MSGEWPAILELRAIWFQMLGDSTAGLARLIESERFAGAAPAGAEARALAVSVLWTAGRSFHVPNSGSHPRLSDVSTPRGAAD